MDQRAILPTGDRQAEVLERVIRERIRQDATFGVQNHDMAYWNVILTEQVGQMSQAVCDMRWGGKPDTEVAKQAVQVAAVAVAVVECIMRGQYVDDITTAKPSDSRQLNIALGKDDESIHAAEPVEPKVCYRCSLLIEHDDDENQFYHVDPEAVMEWIRVHPMSGAHDAMYVPNCKECGRDNHNGTHSALERTGHLNHTFNL